MNDVSTENENASSCMNATNKGKRVHDVSSKLWHCRLGHISRRRIERLIKKSILPPLEFSDLEQCIDCIKGQCRGPNTGVPQKVEPITTEREKLLDA